VKNVSVQKKRTHTLRHFTYISEVVNYGGKYHRFGVHQNMSAEGMPPGALWFSEYLDK
jgi:hypothetical protein